jgi:hypothetical protein
MLHIKASLGNLDTGGFIAEKVDLLFEKRKAIRESALKALHATLSLRFCGEALESRLETLAEGLERVLKDQQPEPTVLALRTASVASITLQSNHHAFFTKLNDIMQKILADEATPLAIRVEVVNTLAITCFMSSIFDHDHDISLIMSTLSVLCEYIFEKQSSPDITRACLQSCMLLASSLPNDIQHEELFEKYFTKIVDLMDENCDIALRICAAKVVTVMVEWEKSYLKADVVSEIEHDLGAVLDKMLAILDDKTKFKNRVDLKKQRGTLKAMILYLEGGPVEEESIVIRNYGLSLHTWTQIFRMERFRAYLGEGFMMHLEENKNLMYMFDYYLDVKAPVIPTMSKQQRRMSLSEASKVATKARFSLRAIREQEMGYATE